MSSPVVSNFPGPFISRVVPTGPGTTLGHPSPFGTILQTAVQGIVYSETLGSTGGVAPYTYSLASGSLPVGLTLSSSGVISGTPSSTGTSTFGVESTDNSGATGVQTFQIKTIAASVGGNSGFVG
jgi:hypothetical protein